jgi:hypothetical protein
MFHFFWFLKWFCRVDVIRFKKVAWELFFWFWVHPVFGLVSRVNFSKVWNFGKGFQARLSGQLDKG